MSHLQWRRHRDPVPAPCKAPLVQATDPTSLIRVVLIGNRAAATSAAPTAPAMPSFGWNLSDQRLRMC